MRTDYKELNGSLRALIGGVPHKTANLANASALLFSSLEDLNWAGFYLMENGKLVLNAFQVTQYSISIHLNTLLKQTMAGLLQQKVFY